MTSEEVVVRQLAAYNAHDLGAFLACYSDEAVIRAGTGEVLARGRAAIEERYGRRFRDLPDLRAEVLTRLRQGPWVVDEERVVAPGSGFELRALVAYHVQDDVIDHVVMMTTQDAAPLWQ